MKSNKPTIAWSEVLKKHKTQTAVQFVENKIISIICSPEQNQIIGEDKIIFSMPNKKQYFKTIAAMQNCVESNPDINVFIKKANQSFTMFIFDVIVRIKIISKTPKHISWVIKIFIKIQNDD